jgi:hypothetical protein
MKNNKQVAKQKSEWLTTTRTTRKLMALKKIKSWNIAVEWQHSNDTWSTEWIEQDSIDKTTFKNIERCLKNHAKIENKQEE